MSITDVIPAADISKVMKAFRAPGSFNFKKLTDLTGLKSKNKDEIKKFYKILNKNAIGFIEEAELELLLKNMSPEGRVLSTKETKEMLAAGDKDGDGKISMDEFVAMVEEA